MHILEPKEIANRKSTNHKAKKTSHKYLLFGILFGLGVVAFWYYKNTTNQATTSGDSKIIITKTNETTITTAKTKTTLKNFTGVQFRDLYRSINYPNTQAFQNAPEITGNIGADNHIRNLAEKKGFVMTVIPVAPIEKTNEKMLAGSEDDLLQPLALKSWGSLKGAAQKDGVRITLASAYRSPKRQRELFTERLYSTGITATQIATGKGDVAVNTTLSLTAVPGYSRHHTGYTIDMYCEDGVAFVASNCNKWISKDNYLNAKKFGFIPSYPPDGGEQGPEPEPWEYVWVGTDSLYE